MLFYFIVFAGMTPAVVCEGTICGHLIQGPRADCSCLHSLPVPPQILHEAKVSGTVGGGESSIISMILIMVSSASLRRHKYLDPAWQRTEGLWSAYPDFR